MWWQIRPPTKQSACVISVHAVDISGQIPGHNNKLNEESNLLGNYPNPFNPTTTINFSIQNNSQVKLTIYNIKGQKLKTLTNNLYEKGYHSIIWYGNDDFNNSVGSGVYMYKLNVNGKIVAVRKCLLLK